VYGITSKVTYQIEVTSATNTSVLYDFVTAGGILANPFEAGGFGGAQAHVFVTNTVNGGNTLQVGDFYGTNGTVLCQVDGCINGTYQVSLLTNHPYNIEVLAGAVAGTNFVITSSAFADPYIYIDSSVLDPSQFSLIISDGVGNSPLAAVPGPIAGAGLPGLMMAGAGLLGWWRRKRKAEAGA
jgi:hypothetical protein